jgi:hypothetical protein
MSVLIKPDTIKVLVPSRDLDEHGWAETEALTDAGDVKGTIQEGSPAFDATATGSGAGPAKPYEVRKGTGYLDGPTEPGDVLQSRSVAWRVESVAFIEDPTGSGSLDCWKVQLSEITYG